MTGFYRSQVVPMAGRHMCCLMGVTIAFGGLFVNTALQDSELLLEVSHPLQLGSLLGR